MRYLIDLSLLCGKSALFLDILLLINIVSGHQGKKGFFSIMVFLRLGVGSSVLSFKDLLTFLLCEIYTDWNFLFYTCFYKHSEPLFKIILRMFLLVLVSLLSSGGFFLP